MNMWKEYKEIAENNGIDRQTFNQRVRSGVHPQEAATRPKRNNMFDDDFYKWRKVAEANGILKATYLSRIRFQGLDYETAATTPLRANYGKKSKKLNNIYAIYRNDENEFEGTPQECADHLKIKLDTFMWYTTPVAQRRVENRKNPDKALVIVNLGCDEDEEW